MHFSWRTDRSGVCEGKGSEFFFLSFFYSTGAWRFQGPSSRPSSAVHSDLSPRPGDAHHDLGGDRTRVRHVKSANGCNFTGLGSLWVCVCVCGETACMFEVSASAKKCVFFVWFCTCVCVYVCKKCISSCVCLQPVTSLCPQQPDW